MATRLLRARSLSAWVISVAVGGLAGCETLTHDGADSVVSHGDAVAPATEQTADEAPPAPVTPSEPSPPDDAERPVVGFIELGTGEFVRPPAPGTGQGSAGGTLTLNFENTSLPEMVKVILGDLLGQNYVVDPAVQGTVTLQTSRPIASGDLMPTLEMLLRMNGAAVVLRGGVYHVVPREQARREVLTPQLGDTDAPLPQGYAVRVVPLRFVSATELGQILEPFAPPGGIVRIDTARNLLLLAGSSDELAGLMETVRIFDVDWLEGLSFGLFTPDFVDATSLAKELAHVFGDEARGPLAGLVRIVPIERLDGLLVISPRPEYLSRAAEWIERLDRDRVADGQRLFVYRVQNGKAADLSEVLTQVFEMQPTEGHPPPAQLAPGLDPVDIRSGGPSGEREAELLAASRPSEDRTPAVRKTGSSVSGGAPVRIIADEINNVLLIMTTARQYRQVAQALRELDTTPLQVLIEATIAEVSLTDELSLGLEWFFKNRQGSRSGDTGLDLDPLGLGPAPGFSYVIRSAGDARLVLNALASDSRLNIVSSPSLMVLNNQEASIQVGDQVPITTRQQQGTETGATLVNNVEFRDTGVLLTVRPRVNAGGLVIMELEQEVSDVAPGSSGSLTPTIQQRKINSTIAIRSGETVVLGGLIRENKNRFDAGVPGLSRIPGLGWLFKTSTDSARRTELVVLITPTAVQDATAAERITEEFRRKMESLKPFYTGPDTEPQQGVSPPEVPAPRSSLGTHVGATRTVSRNTTSESRSRRLAPSHRTPRSVKAFAA